VPKILLLKYYIILFKYKTDWVCKIIRLNIIIIFFFQNSIPTLFNQDELTLKYKYTNYMRRYNNLKYKVQLFEFKNERRFMRRQV